MRQIVSSCHATVRRRWRAGRPRLALFGCSRALWAQNTNRNPWLWFFLGLIFNVFTVIVLLLRNSEDRRRSRQSDVKGVFDPEGFWA
jgi:hypothetical protein